MPFTPGEVLVGKYRVERLLGEGGMGLVVVATHLQLEQRVAIKFMHAAHAAERPDAVTRFLREARAAARIQSEHVARVSDVGTLENGAPYLVMEYLEGRDLEALLREGRPIPLAMAIDYAMQACEGLAEAHAAGIIHRDLKPANLFLAKRSDGSIRVKLLDFGISKVASVDGLPDAGMTSTQALMGSPLYMSPEQLRSSKNVDRRADIWSMGVILYEMFGGQSPFEAETLPEVCARIMAEPPPTLGSIKPELPPALDGVVMRCLEKEPQRRFPDVASLAQALVPFGPPEARAIAERIARLTRASGPSFSEVPASASSPMLAAGPPRPGAAQTNASFSTVGPAIPRRSPALPIAIGAAGLLAGVAIVFGVIATRGRPTDVPVAPAAPLPSVTATVVLAPTAAATATVTATPTSSSTPTPTETPTAAAATTATRMPVRPKPTAGTAPTATSTKPASTSGFGGRN
jgi:serine/threonine-protein kinase